MRRSWNDPRALLEELELEHSLAGHGPRLEAARQQWPMRVPAAFVERMGRGDPEDPLLCQVLPRAVETECAPGYALDPLQEHASGDGAGLLRRFHGRALMVVTGRCAIHCRYCFRRHFPYPDGIVDWRPALDAIAADPSLEEVILSGGDPLTVDDERLGELASCLAAISHVRRLRVHTRVPIVEPARVGDGLLRWLTATRLRPVVVVHVNHANEIDGACRDALHRVRSKGVTLLNQSVLLAGVNDDAGALCDLSQALFDAGVLPYYLHMLDRVQGAAHFEVTEKRARRLIREVTERLPGYLAPRLVRERPGAPAKLPLL